MPLTPATWLADFTVNLTATGNQANPRVTHLANGNILVAWDSDDDTGVGSPTGADVIGQLFNPLGERIGAEFLVNGVSGNEDGNGDVAALSAGGFLTVFEEFDGSSRSIWLTERDADGSNPVSVIIAQDTTANDDETYFDPRVAVASNTSALVVYRVEEAGNFDSRIAGRICDSTTGAVGSEISLINVVGTNVTPAVAALTNGNYVIASATDAAAGDVRINFRVVSATGSNVLGVSAVASTLDNGLHEQLPSVAALTGDGFVIAWEEVTDPETLTLKFQIFSAAGVAQGTAITVDSEDPLGIDSFQPAVVGLADGGFLVLYDREETNALKGQRYDASGTAVGSAFFLASGDGAGDIDAELLADGRVAVTYTNGDGEVGMQILDTRDAANDPGVYGPPDWQIGTIGDDTITSDGDVFFVAGHDGADTINTGGPAASYLGGNGDDRINVIGSFDPADSWDGGAGADSIDFAASFVDGGVFDLEAGTADIATGNPGIRSMTGFENLIGTEGDDTITGSISANTLEGGNGGDTLTGGGGNDTVLGGNGKDRVIHTVSASTYDGGDGTDTLESRGVGFSPGVVIDLEAGEYRFGAFVYSWTNFENWVNRPAGEASSEDVRGTAGANLLDFSALGAGSAITADGRGGSDTILGSAGNDALAGGGGKDRLDGGAGADTMLGGANNDTYVVDLAGDQVFETTATASLIDAGGFDTVLSGVNFNLNANAGVGFVERLTLTGSDNLKATGNALANRLTGNIGNNRLNGGAGNDEMLGGAGNDTYVVDSTGDRVFETTTKSSAIDAGGTDKVQSSVSFGLASNLGVSFVENLTLTGADNINGAGNALANLLIGNGGNNKLNGGAGKDTLTGGAGADGFGFDTALGAANIDGISDFSVVDDTIRLDDAIFTGIATGKLAASAFIANAAGVATTEDHRILYETDTGKLFYDGDGAGGAGRVRFATLDAGLALTAADFFVL